MRASDGLRDLVSDPPGGLIAIDEAIARSLSNGRPRPVLGLRNAVPGPVAAVLRTGLDTMINLTPKVRPA
jgi:hypothetical protein